MNDFLSSLNNREIAVLCWLAAFTVWILTIPGVRSSLAGVAKAFLQWKVWSVFLAAAIYIAAFVYVAWSYDLWDFNLLKDTIVWFFGSAAIVVFKSSQAAHNPNLFRSTLVDLFKLTIFLEFLVDEFVFSLPAEFALVLVLTILAIMVEVSRHQPEHQQVHRFLSSVLGCAGLVFLGFVGFQLFESYRELVNISTLQSILLAPVLTICLMPFAYGFALLSEYEQQFLRVGVWLRERPELAKRAK